MRGADVFLALLRRVAEANDETPTEGVKGVTLSELMGVRIGGGPAGGGGTSSDVLGGSPSGSLCEFEYSLGGVGG